LIGRRKGWRGIKWGKENAYRRSRAPDYKVKKKKGLKKNRLLDGSAKNQGATGKRRNRGRCQEGIKGTCSSGKL